MKRAQFYHNTPDPLALACELVGKAWHGGRSVTVRCADEESEQRLDHMLWTLEPRDFIPHVRTGSPLAHETPVLLARMPPPEDAPQTDILFNLARDVPPDLERYRMVVEIVGQHESDKTPARERWKHYKQHDYRLQAFDSVLREAL